ncbi:MAG: aminotransferase class I/II-fold pyridoxal phosphate-dependent enzyme [Bacteroidales bacterium]|nr:aminotransferase class I/II-fold pyridoxal phosphate-dependent enzyme [Bacteroidales bacterium]
MDFILEKHLDEIEIPANLRINDQIKTYRKRCAEMGCHRPYHHFAFGQSPFSPPPVIVNELRKNASKHDYVPTAGIPELLNAIASYYNDVFGLNCAAGQVVVSPGSKEMISLILGVLSGAVVIPTPAWVSYLPQAKILKKKVIPLRLKPEDQYKLTPQMLVEALHQSKYEQHTLILNNPNNPTGAVYSKHELEKIGNVCKKHKTIVIADEIYARTSFRFEEFVSMARVYPEGTIVTGGLSKDRSAGGYRMGVGIFPDNKKLINDILILAGSTYSCVAAPIQYASLVAFSKNSEIEKYIHDCSKIHKTIGTITASLLNKIPGVRASIPQGAFYLYVDFNDHAEKLRKIGFDTSAAFCEHMIKVEHTAMLPASSLLLPDDDFSVRISYVDYDGDKVLEVWQQNPPVTDEEKINFFQTHCPSIDQGIKNIERYFQQVEVGKLPVHV